MNQTAMTKMMGFLAVAALSPGLGADKGATDRLAEEADAVVVGEIQSGQQTGRSHAFVLSVARTIKGDLAVGTTVNVSGITGLASNRSLKGQYGLWFLKKRGERWALVPVFSKAIALETSCYFPLSTARSPASVRTTSPPVTVGDKMAVELAAALPGYTSPLELFNLAWGLYTIGESSLVTELYRTLRTSPDPQLKYIGLTGLLRGDDEVSVLAEVADNADLIPRLHTSSLLVPAICGITNSDPRAIRALGKISFSPTLHPSIPRCAAMALKSIHTLDTLPFLGPLLDSSDVQTREYAMQGLSRFVDNLPIPTPRTILNGQAVLPQGPQPYRTAETDKYSLSKGALGSRNETEFLHFWRSWWATMKDKLTAQSP